MKTKHGVSKGQVRVLSIAISLSFLTAALLPAFTSAVEPAVRRGTSSTYAVLAGLTITNTGATSLSGTAGSDIGLSPGTSFTGNTLVTTGGAVHLSDVAAATAKLNLETAFGDVAGAAPAIVLPTDLVGRTIVPGIYKSDAGTFENSGNMTFDAGGNANAVFIFQTTATLVTTVNSSMVLTNGAQACNVYWQVGSSATLGVGSNFIGSIYALTSISAQTGAKISGQLLARNGSVTLDTNVITNDACVVSTPVATVTPTPTPVATVTPTPIEELIREETATVTPTPIEELIREETATVTSTEEGGKLPDTGSNSFNYLLVGGGLLVLGSSGLLIRRRIA